MLSMFEKSFNAAQSLGLLSVVIAGGGKLGGRLEDLEFEQSCVYKLYSTQ